MIYGYAGASTDVDAQARRLRAAGAGRVLREITRSYNVSHSTMLGLEALQSQ